MERATAGFVQQPIHDCECLSGGERFSMENPVRRQAVVESPREEDGSADFVIMRKVPAGEQRKWNSGWASEISQQRPADRAVGRGSWDPPYRLLACRELIGGEWNYFAGGFANFAASIGTLTFRSVSLKESFPSSHE